MTQIKAEVVMDMLYTGDVPPDIEVEMLNDMGGRTGEQKLTPGPITGVQLL